MRSVIIIGGIQLLREGLAQLLRTDGRVDVVGCSGSVDEATELLRTRPRTIVLIDMASDDSFESVRLLRATHAHVPVVALGVAQVDVEIVSCAEAGVAGYVPRNASVDDLVRCLEGAFEGEVYCSPRLVAALFKRLAELAPAAVAEVGGFVRLTRRERQVFELLEQKLTNKQIARTLGIELSTVKNHVHRVLHKLNLQRRIEVAAQGVVLTRRRSSLSRPTAV